MITGVTRPGVRQRECRGVDLYNALPPPDPSNPDGERQPRIRAVPCSVCLVPTMNLNACCDKHQPIR